MNLLAIITFSTGEKRSLVKNSKSRALFKSARLFQKRKNIWFWDFGESFLEEILVTLLILSLMFFSVNQLNRKT